MKPQRNWPRFRKVTLRSPVQIHLQPFQFCRLCGTLPPSCPVKCQSVSVSFVLLQQLKPEAHWLRLQRPTRQSNAAKAQDDNSATTRTKMSLSHVCSFSACQKSEFKEFDSSYLFRNRKLLILVQVAPLQCPLFKQR